MWIILLAWKNLWRNKSRTWITILSIFFATLISTLASSLKNGIFDQLVMNMVSSYTGHIQISRQGYQDEQTLENAFFPSDAIGRKILNQKGADAMTGRLVSFALTSYEDKTKGCMIVGVEATESERFMHLKNKIHAGQLANSRDNKVMVAKELAKELQIMVNDTLILIGQGYHGASAGGKYPVSGIIDLGSPQLNKKLIIMPLLAAQQLLGADSLITTWSILTSSKINPEQLAENIQSAIGADFETLTWGELMPDIKQHIDADSGNMQIIQYILYFLVSFGVFSTLLIMMSERKRENGMLLALGMHKRVLQKLMFIELIFAAMIGATGGLLIAYPIAIILKKYPLQISGKLAETYSKFGFEPIFPTSTDPVLFLSQWITVFIMGTLLGLYPMFIIQKMKPVEAMKK
jgi:ABC-type lipoprotein release transport system permease subunit